MKTTIHNHSHAATGTLPLIPNIIFKETIESLNRGEADFYKLVITEYSLEANQKRMAEGRYNDLIKK